MDAAPERKLTTILVADAAGYSRLMGEDEAATLSLLRSYRELIGSQIARHRGRVVSTAGDSVLAEFASVVNAVECAVRIQRELAERNAGLPEERRMRFRIGINLGDVMVEGDDLFGEGVNIAARLEQIADPDGILISGAVFEQVRTKLSLGFDFLGPQEVKNISERVPVYRIVLEPGATPPPERIADGEGAAAPRRDAASAAAIHAGAPLGVAPQAGGALLQRVPYQRLYRRAALAAVLIAFFSTINFFTWHGVFWAKWPSLTVLFIFAVRSIWVGLK
jgi:adenylate cyclase